ncbi:MAG TPA: chemotaxis protein CheW [Thermoanaerobaculia bacterium]|nr:chemotaxis protein CheW [Thermoanaerobaculia bacterium]
MTAPRRDLRLITFRAGPETFVLDIMAVRQIIPYAGTTSVPTAPDFVEGIIVARNEVIPVVDLRARLYPRMSHSPHSLILITRSMGGVIGLRVDDVRRIITASPDSLLPPPPLIGGVRGDLLIAIIPSGDEVFLLIDLEAVLTEEEKGELSKARETMNERRNDEG